MVLAVILIFVLPRQYVVVLEVRNSTPRAQGPFAHALLAGTFGATLPPLLYWLWKGERPSF
jgi:hypothetical protein